MKLYFSKGACSLTVRIIINELGLPCEYESVDLKAKKTETGKNYFEINPKGAVPALETNDGEILTENAVILQYLADTLHATQLLSPLGDFKRYRILEWLNYVTTELHKSLGVLFNSQLNDEVKEKFFKPVIKSKLKYLNQQIQERNYLIDNDFTLPDAYLFVMITWLNHFKLDLKEYSNLQRYFKHQQQRPSIMKSLEEEKLV